MLKDFDFACGYTRNTFDKNGIRSNCPPLVQKFHADVRANGKIDLNFTGDLSWFLGVRYSYGDD